ncbi:type I restriction endonuclease subunit S [Dietzia sp. WMMA184]|uniref:type I restriction endonuclease subunit S n=1 Tax=Dietzia sp. WMMA184 TaxID=2039808 RepID=UPI001C1F68B2|nr:type I restriction endonuclease subunit S [Dietzia sp. WMMA184]
MELTGNRVVINKSDRDVAKRVLPNDFIIHLRSFQGGIEHSRVSGKVTNAYTVLRPVVGADPEYYRYFLKSDPFISGLSSMTDQLRDGQSISFGKFSTMRLPLPPLPAQRAIANYLDRETAEIDAMAAKLDELVGKLEERELDLILSETQVYSDINHTRLELAAEVSLGKTFQGKQKSESESLTNYVRAASIQHKGVLVLDDQMMWMSLEELNNLSLRAGDVLVVEGGAGYGRSTCLTADLPSWGFQNHVIRVRPRPGWFGPFIDYTIRAHKAAGLIELLAVGATIPGLSSEKVRSLPIAAIPMEDQITIAQRLAERLSLLDSMIAGAQELKTLLTERRSALIAEVVTGRKEVPVS